MEAVTPPLPPFQCPNHLRPSSVNTGSWSKHSIAGAASARSQIAFNFMPTWLGSTPQLDNQEKVSHSVVWLQYSWLSYRIYHVEKILLLFIGAVSNARWVKIRLMICKLNIENRTSWSNSTATMDVIADESWLCYCRDAPQSIVNGNISWEVDIVTAAAAKSAQTPQPRRNTKYDRICIASSTTPTHCSQQDCRLVDACFYVLYTFIMPY